MADVLSMMNFAVKKEAGDNLLKLNIADYPNMKKEDRKRVFTSLRKIAYPLEGQEMKSTEDLMGFLNG